MIRKYFKGKFFTSCDTAIGCQGFSKLFFINIKQVRHWKRKSVDRNEYFKMLLKNCT